jgi:hypothetical protein
MPEPDFEQIALGIVHDGAATEDEDIRLHHRAAPSGVERRQRRGAGPSSSNSQDENTAGVPHLTERRRINAIRLGAYYRPITAH